MKKGISIILCLILLFGLCGCSSEKRGKKNYQYMYDGIIVPWNLLTTKEHKTNSLLGYGGYKYNSYLILFPRETPSTIDEYYYHWVAAIDCDLFAIYFTCKLTEDNYKGFSAGLSNFTITYGEDTVSPLYDDKHFSLPTYILQWTNPDDKWEVLEYVMLDDKNNTAIFVYSMSLLEDIETNSSYDISPSSTHFLNNNFSIYGSYSSDNYYSAYPDIIEEDFNNSTYDTSFLSYLM